MQTMAEPPPETKMGLPIPPKTGARSHKRDAIRVRVHEDIVISDRESEQCGDAYRTKRLHYNNSQVGMDCTYLQIILQGPFQA